MAALKSFTDDGLFVGQAKGFFDYRFKLSKVMPEGMMFPYDFGFVPATKAEDGDPLDVLVLTESKGPRTDRRILRELPARA